MQSDTRGYWWSRAGCRGYDALALIIEDKEEVAGRLTSLLETYHGGEDDNVVTKSLRLLKVKQDMEGIRSEALNTYHGWI